MRTVSAFGYQLACATLFLLATCLPLRAEPIDDYNTALKLYEQKRWEAAAKGFAAFLKEAPQHPKSPLAQLYQGQALTHAQKYKDARAVFREFLKSHSEHPDAPLAAYRIGESSYFLSEYPAAAQELGEFVTKYPKHDLTGWGWQYLGETQLQLGFAAQTRFYEAAKKGLAAEAKTESQLQQEKATEAIKALNVVIARQGAEAEQLEAKYALAQAQELLADTYRNRGQSTEETQVIEQALTLFREVAASSSPRAAESIFSLAKLLYQTGKYAEAAAGFEQLITRFPRGTLVPTAELNAGYSYYQIGEFAKAEPHFASAALTSTLSSTANYWVGMSRKGREDWTGAITVFSELSKQPLTGDLPQKVVYHWADSEAKRKQFAEARKLYESVVAKWPASDLADDSAYSAADCALKAGDFASALALTESFTTQYPNSTLKQLNDLVLGKSLLARGDQTSKTDPSQGQVDYRAAATLFRAVVTNSQIPKTAMQARVHLAFAERRLKNYPAVVEALTPIAAAIRKGEPGAADFISILPTLGEAHQLAGQPGEAEAILLEALNGLPADADRRQILAKLAEVRALQGRWTEMQAALDQLKQADPDSTVFAEAVSRAADHAIAEREWENASQLLAVVIQLGETSAFFADALMRQGTIQFEQMQYSAAAQTYEQLLKAQGVNAAVRAAASLNQGVCLEKEAGNDPQKLLAAARTLEDGILQFAVPPEKELTTEDDRLMVQHVVNAARTAAAIHIKLVPPQPHDPQKPLTTEDLAAWIAQPDVKTHLTAADQLSQSAFEQNAKLPAAEQLHKPDDLLNDWALQQFSAGDQARGDLLLTRLFTDYPTSPHAGAARLTVARGHAYGGRAKEARDLFQVIQNDAGTDPTIKLESLETWMNFEAQVQNWAESGRLAQQLLETPGVAKSNALYAKFRRGESQLQLGEFDAALTALTELRADPATREATWRDELDLLWAEGKLLQKDYDPIREVLGAMLKAQPTGLSSDLAHEILGRVDRNESLFPEARVHFETVVKSPTSSKSPLAARAQLQIGDTYFLEKKLDDAMIAYTAVHTNYNFPEIESAALLQVARIDIGQKQWMQAQSSLNTLLTEFPDSKEATEAKSLLKEVEKNLPAAP